MKNASLIFALLFSIRLQAQEFIVVDASCGLSDSLFHLPEMLSFSSDQEAIEVMNRITEIVGLGSNFTVQAANIPNAAAAIIGTQRYILYNPGFIRKIRLSSSHDWPAISVLAHELGHHLNGHTLQMTGSRPEMELEADEFSGFVLRKMGASLDESQVALKMIASPYGSLTHPPAWERLDAVETGWNRADTYLKGNYQAPVSYAPKNALYQVSFNANPDRLYFLTDDYSFVAVKGNSRVRLGGMSPNSSVEYPYVIYFNGQDKSGIYMSRSGDLVTRTGKIVGQASFLRE